MWRPWNMDSQEEQWGNSYNEASDGVPMLASDSDESVTFVVQRPSQSCRDKASSQGLPPMACLLFQVQAVTHHPLESLS